MFDVPVDALYLWLGVATVSLAMFGVVAALPSATPPDATDAARAIDAVGVGPPGSQGSHALDADRVKLGPHRIGLGGPDGEAHATFTYGPITPAIEESRLARVVDGERPQAVFGSQAEFAEAVSRAENPDVETPWRPAPDRLQILRVQWGDVNATLVG